MCFLKSFANLHHHGRIVTDIAGSIAALESDLGMTFAPVRKFDPIRVWLPEDGWGEAHIAVTYSRVGPIHLELIEMLAPGPYEALKAVSTDHVGAWVPNVGDEVEALMADGWDLVMAGASPKHRYGQMAYLAKDGGPVLELVGEPIRPMIEEWIASTG
ncbi:VOC family protein [Croceicoccus gelatinilyticus]|uniref:VOC family protein n=1 Tax=Croceicoccus gelatinilyticus TaxID=2835536 RepID=UPI001BCDC82B|nr:VOC family protein [Croceicoccus gelatinilyticus]